NGSRFQTCSTVIVDYSMPEMNGLEFMASLKNPYIKKVLLTGQADSELAVKAFNRHLIDQFIDKHDPRLKTKLNGAITAFQDQYFRTSFKLITDPIIANNHDAFLVDGAFQKFFEEIRRKLNCVEYYMIDDPRTGYLMVDGAGRRRCLLIFTEQALSEHCEILEDIGAPRELREGVAKGELLPAFDDQDESLSATDSTVADWRNHYFPGMRVDASSPFFVTIVSDELLPEIHGKSII